MIKTVLFDLDGTLLPMDNDKFVKGYFELLCRKMAPLGYDPQELVKAVWAGTAAMVSNNGEEANETVFWRKFAGSAGERVYKDKAVVDEFYRVDFNKAKELCGYNEKLVELVADLKAAGYRIVLATNPIFPSVATENRIRWAGFVPEDFEFFTAYENIGLSKPNIRYYEEILKRLDLKAEECIMIGNDVQEDMIAAQTGMSVYLLTDCLINRDGTDISVYPHGDADGIRNILLG